MKKFALSAGALALSLSFSALAQDSTAHCSLPGELITSDATGDATFIVPPSPVPDHDVLDVYIAELPNAAGEQKVYFTLTIDQAAPASLPTTSYQVKFFLKDGVERFVLFNPYPVPAQLNPVTGVLIPNSDLMFAFGSNGVDPTSGNPTFSIDGPADEESSVSADGTITIVLSQKQLRALEPGAELKDISGVSQFNGAAVTFDLDTSDTAGSYTLRGNASCAAASGKAGVESFGGALGYGLLLPLFVMLGLRRRA